MEQGDLSKVSNNCCNSQAERMLDKAQRLNPTNKAQTLLYKLDTMKRRAAAAQESGQTTGSTTTGSSK